MAPGPGLGTPDCKQIPVLERLAQIALEMGNQQLAGRIAAAAVAVYLTCREDAEAGASATA